MFGHERNFEEKDIPVTAQSYLYTKDNFPCLVRHGLELEALPSAAENSDEYYQVNARNALRKLTYGTPLFKGHFLKWSNLKLAWLNFKALFLKRDPKLLNALRSEMKIIFQKAYQISKHCDPEAEKRLEIFVSTLLSNFPFMDPVEGEEVEVPQKINQHWQLVNYKFRKIDISPKTGLLAKLLEEEDRIYAFGMEPQNREANPYLLLMGTTYFSGQGSGLSLMGDVTPGQSVGERHDLTDLEKWIFRHRNIKITGHSQGGTMALIVAAKYPEYTLQADCLNPAALHQTTLRKLRPWWQVPRKSNPELRVFTQVGDPVFIFGDGFLPGTRIFQVDHPKAGEGSGFSSHAHHFSGHESASYHEWLNYHSKVNSNKRKFFNDLKAVADLMVGPLLGLNLVYSIIKRKLKRFCSEHAKTLRALLFVAALATCVTFMLMGGLAPLGAALALQGFTPILVQGLLTVSALAASAVSMYVAPKVVSLAVNLTQAAVGLAMASVIGMALVLSGLVAGALALKRACLGGGQSSPDQLNQEAGLDQPRYNQSTQISLRNFGVEVRAPSVLEVKAELKRSHSESELSKLSFLTTQQAPGQLIVAANLAAFLKPNYPRTP